MREPQNAIMRQLEIEQFDIKGKRVFIFEEHHHALYPWALVKREWQDTELNLFSFDYHTDTHDPFLAHVCNGRTINYDEMNNLISSIHYRDDYSVLEAIQLLKHDEHIKTAIRCGILNHAFVIAQEGKEEPLSYEEKSRLDNLWTPESINKQIMGISTITPRSKRTYPQSDIYITDFWQDGYENNSYDLILDDFFLNNHFETFSKMNDLIKPDGTVLFNYILDIDLDYFTTPNSITPKEYRLFSKLVKNAVVITIAKESVCVDMCSNGLNNADDLLEKLLSFIEGIL